MNIFKDNNDWNEKAIVGFVAFVIMCIIMIADLVSGWTGQDLVINEFIYNILTIIVKLIFIYSSIAFAILVSFHGILT